VTLIETLNENSFLFRSVKARVLQINMQEISSMPHAVLALPSLANHIFVNVLKNKR